LLGTHGAWVLGGNWQTRGLVPRADAPTATGDSTELRRPCFLLEHEAQDDTGDDEARQRVRDDPHPCAPVSLRRIRRGEDAVEQGCRHAPRLMHVVQRERRPVRALVMLATG